MHIYPKVHFLEEMEPLTLSYCTLQYIPVTYFINHMVVWLSGYQCKLLLASVLGSIFAIYTSLLWFLCNIYLIIIGYSDVVPSLGVTVMVVSNCGMDCGLDSEERYQASIQGCMCSGDFSASQGHMDTAEPWKQGARFNISLNKATNYAQS